MGDFFCSVHCKLEQLNYSSLVAVIKYGDRPRDAESAELPGLLWLWLGAMVKAADPAASFAGGIPAPRWELLSQLHPRR